MKYPVPRLFRTPCDFLSLGMIWVVKVDCDISSKSGDCRSLLAISFPVTPLPSGCDLMMFRTCRSVSLCPGRARKEAERMSENLGSESEVGKSPVEDEHATPKLDPQVLHDRAQGSSSRPT